MRASEENVLFVFAHQDDEMAAASRILFERARGAIVHCAFLTDGGLTAAPSIRDRESLRALTELGVDGTHIAFIGSALPIADGALIDHLAIALQELERRMRDVELATVYCLAWEGGHHDHDASHLVAVAFSARRGMPDRCVELPLYRASRIRGMFRVLAPRISGAPWERRRLRWRDALRAAWLVRHYRSQFRSWLGLFPELFVKLVLLRREVSRTVDIRRLGAPPDLRPLLYESRFGCSWERFRDAAAPFLAARIPASTEATRNGPSLMGAEGTAARSSAITDSSS
jgi:LmbE family N-acetylglucosaminyl deacetylase